MTQGYESLLRTVDVKKVNSPYDVSPLLMWHCASELVGPFSEVFTSRVGENTSSSIQKEAYVVPLPKKISRYNPINYKPISLLDVLGKVLEKVNVLSDQRLDLYPADSRQTCKSSFPGTGKIPWNGLDTLVIVLDIAGAFDRV